MQPLRIFSTSNNNNGIRTPEEFEETRKEILAKERAHFESLSEKDKAYFQAYRLSLIKSMEAAWADKTNWFNKVQEMTQDEIEALPKEYLRRFGTYIVKAREQ